VEHSGDAVSAGTGAAAGTRGRAPWTVVAVAVVVLAAAAGAYAAGSAHAKTRTKTVVQKVTVTVPASPTTVAALKCVPGAAPGSCNTDEAEEIAIPDQPLDANTHAVLASQLVAARAAALRYPTVADAERAGMLLAGGFSPLTGAHFMDLKYSTGPFDPAHPGSYIYDGIDPSSKIIGLMYLGSDVNPPEGFAGPNDHWHRHSNTCVVFDGGGIKVPFPADSSVTKTQCDNVHGVFMRRTIWMVHAWVVPGYESPSGVFAHDNSDVRCADGSVKTDAAGFCSGT
jgi:hypothetical protein